MRLAARGIGLLIGGAGLGVLAASLQSTTAARLAATVLAVPVVAIVWALVAQRSTRRIGVVRRVEPRELSVGESATVHLQPAGGTLPPWTSVRERVPASMHRRSAGGSAYTITPDRRGVFALGPAHVHRTDPLNLVRWRVRSVGSQELMIWPQTHDLSGVLRSGTLDATVPRPHGSPQRNLEDLTVREYRRGDDMHRVHWKSSAKRGELMVRHDEPATTARVDLILDLGEDADSEPDASTEWAVSACASLALTLIRDRYTVRLLTSREIDGELISEPIGTPSAAELLDAFAQARALGPEHPHDNTDLVRHLRTSGAPVAVAVLRAPTQRLLAALEPLAMYRRCVGLVVDPEPGTDLTALGVAGWRVTAVPHGGSVRAAWTSALADGVAR